jgi:FkbM family methyltransferase
VNPEPAHDSVRPGLATRVATLMPDAWFTGAMARAYRRFEPELPRIDDFCPRGGTALDVGAWYGPWSRALASRADRVIAFEPNPSVALVLRRTVPANVEVVEAVAGAGTTTTAQLWVPLSGRGTEGIASTLAHADDAVPVTVPATTLDAVVAEQVQGAVSIIKIDVEGAEQAVLAGAADTLATHRPVLLIELEYHRSDVDATVAGLTGLGYVAEVLVDGAWRALASYDLAAHQAAVRPKVDGRGLIGRILRPGPTYVNNVLFRAAG